MSLDGFVRAAGAAMGMARESFGTGGVALAPPPGLGPRPDRTGDGSGAAATAFSNESTRIDDHLAALSEHDAASGAQLQQALTSAGVSRGRMDSVIATAVADVQAMGMSTNTVEGQKALVAAIKRHLEDTKSTLGQGSADASTQAASANANAAGYQSIAHPPAGAAPAMPQMPMPQLPQMPMGGMGGGFPMGGGMPLAPLGALGNLFSRTGFAQDAGHTSNNPVGDGLGGNVPGSENTSSAAAIPVSEVDLRKKGFPGGADAYRDYIGKTLDHKGITDPVARANWTRGFMTAASRESGFRPDAVNMSDSNAHGARMADGAPANSSRGGLQTIPSTFAANHEPGTSRSIYDPIANIAAAMNYVMRRYHVARDGSNLSSVGQFNPHHAPGGY